jgi:hypothetical protein
MAYDRNTVITHVYGLAGLIPGVVSIVYLINTGASWHEYALVASGWVAAIFYAIMLLRSFTQARADGLKIGNLSEKVRGLKSELKSRNNTLDFLSGLLIGKSATPRAAAPAPDGDEND